MKKRLLKIVSLGLAVMLGCGLLIGCGSNKTSISANDFKDIMEDNGYEIVDAAEQFAEYDHVKTAYIAIDETASYQIEFYSIADEDAASQMFYSNKETIENTKGTATGVVEIKMGNYDKYSLTTNGKYKVVARIDNTMIYCNVDEDYKDDVKEIIELLGY
jgi:hypothetical protein